MREAHQLEPGTNVGPYRIERSLAGGGFGEVYLAVHAKMERQVALKVLHRRLVDRAELVQRFLREAQLVASIRHPAIVQLYDAGVEMERHQVWIALELLNGIELRERVYRNAPVTAELGTAWALEIARALEAVHAVGVVHRDLKPSNIFVVSGPEGESLKLLDFGIAKVVRPDDGRTMLTQTGEALGTPLYMAPEQFRDAKRVDERADIYGMGAVLYEVFTRRAPIVASNYPEMLTRLLSGEQPPPLQSLRPDLPKELCDIVHRAMAHDLDVRFQTAVDVIAALERPRTEPPSRRARSKFGGTMQGTVSGFDATVLGGEE